MATATAPPQQRFNMRYLPTEGSRITQEQADTWGPFLADRPGATYEELLSAAVTRRSEVRGDMLTNDAEAAHEYRLGQVRHFARSVDVAYEVRNAAGVERTHQHRAFHPVVMEVVGDGAEAVEQISASIRPRQTNQRQFSRVHSTFDVLGDGESRAQLMRRFQSELDGLLTRWARYAKTDKVLRSQLGERLVRAARRFQG